MEKKRKKKMRPKILIIGNYTIDLLGSTQREGGAPIYSSLGITSAGGMPYIMSNSDKTVFKIEFNADNRRLVLVKSGGNINLDEVKYYTTFIDGVLVNPVCKEVNEIDLIKVKRPIAVDLQGFVRNCELMKEIENIRNVIFPKLSNYIVAHGNDDEFRALDDGISKLFNAGFKELLISYGRDGFDLVTPYDVKWFPVYEVGNFEVGNGDFLLGTYYTYRLMGLSPIDAAYLSRKLVEDFSNSRIHL
ncbi:MAG: hypothetical protein JZD40_02700 [Sulfolobus sp.]|nr:hypothetical protein [Sulfolobus sp.]